MSERELPVEIINATKTWYWGHVTWLAGGMLLGVLGIVLPAVIASGLVADATNTKLVALTATVISGLTAYLRCEIRADRLHIAWRYIQTAKLRYGYQENYTVEELISEFDRGEQVIESAYSPISIEPQPHSN
jgi:hypothetical protein